MIMLEDICALPSGTQIIIADMLIPGAIFQHGNGHQYVIKDIGKVKINNNWIDSVNYRRVESDIAITYTRTVDDFMKAMTKELQEYEIWSPEYQDNGIHQLPTLIGKAQGYCFQEACFALYKERGKEKFLSLSNANNVNLEGWGTLSPTEAGAMLR